MTRAGVLILVEHFWINLTHDPIGFYPGFGVLSVIALSLISIAALRRLSNRTLIVFGLGLLLAVQAYYYYNGQPTEPGWLRTILLASSGSAQETVCADWPFLAWLPVVLLGFISGRWLVQGTITLEKYGLNMGTAFLCLWLIVRAGGGYGNLYTAHPLIMTRTPPSLAYFLFYLGFVFLLLSLHSRLRQLEQWRAYKVITVFGQTALFFYLVHGKIVIFLISFLVRRLNIESTLLNSFLISITSGVILYFLCARYRTLRRNHPNSVLKYL